MTDTLTEAFKYVHEHLGRTPGNYFQIGNSDMIKELAPLFPYRKFTSIDDSKTWGENHSDLELEAMNVTAVFVDGNNYEEALNNLKLADRLLPKGGFIYVDNAQIPQVCRAIRDFGMQAKFQNGGAIIWV